MITWIGSHLGDMVVLAVLALIAGSIIASLVRTKKKGKCCGSSGCSGCAGCVMGGARHRQCS